MLLLSIENYPLIICKSTLTSTVALNFISCVYNHLPVFSSQNFNVKSLLIVTNLNYAFFAIWPFIRLIMSNYKPLQGRIQKFWIGVQITWGGSICAVWPIFPEIPHENEII